MKRIILFASFISTTLFANAQLEQLEWARAVQTGFATCQISALAADGNGNVYVTGTFSGELDFSVGNNSTPFFNGVGLHDAFIAKIDPAGNLIWGFDFGSDQGADAGSALSVDVDGNLIVAGGYRGTVDFDFGNDELNMTAVNGQDIFVIKLTPSGELIWAKSIGGDISEGISAIETDESGNIYATGSFNSSQIDFDPGPGTSIFTNTNADDIHIFKWDKNGNYIWAKTVVNTTQGAANGQAIAVDHTGNVIVAGYFNGTMDFDPGAGTANLTGGGFFEGFVLKLDGSGNYLWAKSIGGIDSDVADGVGVDASGNVYIQGTFRGTVDFDLGAGTNTLVSNNNNTDLYVLKLNGGGVFEWVKTLSGKNGEISRGLHLDSQGNIYSIGSFFNKVDFDPSADSVILTTNPINVMDAFIWKLDANGNYLWAGSFRGKGTDNIYALDIDANDNVYTTGTFNLICDLDPTADSLMIVPGSSNTPFIVKLNQGQTTSSISENVENQIEVYPNPSQGDFRIQHPNLQGVAKISIYNSIGQIIHSQTSTSGSIECNLNHVASGVYYLQIQDNNKKTYHQKLIIRE
jgi:hypothetical protein